MNAKETGWGDFHANTVPDLVAAQTFGKPQLLTAESTPDLLVLLQDKPSTHR